MIVNTIYKPIYVFTIALFSSYFVNQDLHSFPTRRSSDLRGLPQQRNPVADASAGLPGAACRSQRHGAGHRSGLESAPLPGAAAARRSPCGQEGAPADLHRGLECGGGPAGTVAKAPTLSLGTGIRRLSALQYDRARHSARGYCARITESIGSEASKMPNPGESMPSRPTIEPNLQAG